MLGTNDPKLSPVGSRHRGISFGVAGLSLGSIGLVFSNPFAGRISGGWIAIDGGNITIKFWKKYKALPSSSDSINKSGIASAVTYFEFTKSDFKTLVVRHGDVFAVEIVSFFGVGRVAGALHITPF